MTKILGPGLIQYPYFYFEIYSVQGEDELGESVMLIPERMQNENALLFPPHTNSTGYWGYTNVTTRTFTYRRDTQWVKVEQWWIDLNKYKNDNDRLEQLVQECQEKLKIKQ